MSSVFLISITIELYSNTPSNKTYKPSKTYYKNPADNKIYLLNH